MPQHLRNVVGAVCFCAALATNAFAGTDAGGQPQPAWQLELGAVIGTAAPDGDLADFRWDINPALQTGLAATIYHGRFGFGARVLRTQTTQASGIPGETQAPDVNLTTTELVGRVKALEYWGVALWGSAHGGLLHVGYDPDRLTFDTGILPEPITIDYASINEFAAGLGVELRTEIARHAAISLQAEQTTFALDTAHRVGSEIVQSRDRFYSWSLQLQVSWLLGLN